jgi:hypothetical protein
MKFETFVAFLDLDNVCQAVGDLERLSRSAKDIIECRVESVLETMGSLQLCVLPDEPVSVSQFLQMNEAHCSQVANQLSR